MRGEFSSRTRILSDPPTRIGLMATMLPDERLATSRTLVLAERLGALHELIYRRGGIRPVNAAVEELTKLLFLRIAASRSPKMEVPGYGPIAELTSPRRVQSAANVDELKAAFRAAISLPHMMAQLPDGRFQEVWPLDEPLRLSRPDIAAEALSILSGFSVPEDRSSTLDVLGTAFDVFLQGKYEHAGGLGTYLTPHAVVASMARIALALVDPLDEYKGGPVFGDPCCGTGRFLVELLHQLLDREREPGRRRSDALKRFVAEGVFGADQSSAAVGMGRVNMLSFGLDHPALYVVDDSITDENLDRLRGSLKLILTNPPFGDSQYDSKEGLARTASVIPNVSARQAIDPAIAFLARSLDLLADNGVLGIILPDGIVEGTGMKELLFGSPRMAADTVTLEAVVSLPKVTFAPAGTTAKTSAVFLRKGMSRRNSAIFSRADHVGYLKQGGNVVVDPGGNDLVAITKGVEELLSSQGTHPRKRHVVSSRPFTLDVPRTELDSLDLANLDALAVEARETLAAEGGRRLGEFLSMVPTRRDQGSFAGPFVSILHVDELGVVDWVKAEKYEPLTPGIRAEAGQLIVSLINPSKLRATVVPDRYEAIWCSAEFGVFESSLNVYGVLRLLYEARVRAQLAPLGRGTSSSRRRIRSRDVLELIVPNRDDGSFGDSGDRLRRLMEDAVLSRTRLARELER